MSTRPIEDDAGHARRPAATTSGKAIFSLVLGLLSFFCVPFLLVIPAAVLGFMGIADVNRGQGRVSGKGMAIAGIITSLLSVLIWAGVGIVGYYGYIGVSSSASRVRASNNLMQIGIAFHNYHDSHTRFPPQAVNGKSWRVEMLPYLEQGHIYSQIKRDEPWDSPTNRAFLTQMPRTYASPGKPYVIGQTQDTHYQTFTGPGTVQDQTPVNMMNITDGTSNTLIAAEATDPVPWMKPQDMTYTPNGPLPRLGGVTGTGFLVLFADGSVRYFNKDINETTLRALITRSGNEAVSPP